MPILKGVKFDRHWESQKTIVTIEFATLTLCRVQNFIKIKAFTILRPKLWPNRWQVPTLTGVNIDRHQKLQKTIVNIEFTALDLCRVQNFIKIEHLPFFVQNYGLKDDRCQHWQGVKNHRKLLWSINSAPLNCSLCKISWTMVNLIPRSPFPVPHSPFPVPLSPFPFLQITLSFISIDQWKPSDLSASKVLGCNESLKVFVLNPKKQNKA